MPTGITPLNATASARQGMKAATDLAARAAADVQLSFHPEVTSGPRAGSAGSPAPASAVSSAARVEISSAGRDLATAMTDSMKAEASLRANVKVFQTAEDMTRTITDLKR